MKVVLIGPSGHIGTYLVPRLVEAGHEVVAVSRGQRQPYLDGAAWAKVERARADRFAEDKAGTFGDHIASMGPDAVIDLICFEAASAHLLAEALAPRHCYLLHCGTIWTHGTAVEVPVREAEARQPYGDYGTKKAEIEELLLGLARDGSLTCTVLHPGHIVGPGWPPVNPAGNFNLDVFGRLARGERLALPNFGQETIHHVHADDVALAFALALEAPEEASGQAFHVVSERAVTLRGYAEQVASWFGREADLAFEPFDQWKTSWAPPDAEATWEHISRSPSMSIEKAKHLLGYAPRYSSLEAVAESLSWLVGHGEVDTAGRPMDFRPRR
jgi:nucleoside-diphosphate-sugar epimerase